MSPLRFLRRDGPLFTNETDNCSLPYSLFASQGLSASEGITDPRDNTVPLALLGCGVVNQHAVHEATSKITAVVPDLAIAEAGNHEKIRRHPFIDNVRGRVHLCKKHSR
jgi:hypothetical protein